VALPSGAPLPGLVSRWDAESNSQDAVGGSNGIFLGGAPTAGAPDTSQRYVPGKFGSAFNFVGTEPRFHVGRVAGLAPGNTPHSIALWVKVEKLPAEDKTWLLLLGRAGTNSLSHHWILHSDGRLQVGPWDGKGVAGHIKAGEWTHLATTFDGTTLMLYINGALAAAGPTKFNLQGIPLEMGKRENAGSHSFTGLVDDIAIYNRALSAAAVGALYQAGNTATATASH
jgi:hypothetical protein